MLKKRTIFFFILFIALFSSCTSPKNTSGTRWYHSFNTRYNVYFNGEEAFKKAMKEQQKGYTESYTDIILMYPVSSLPKDKGTPGGPFDKAIEKSVKAIKTHSIKTKPPKEQGKRNDPKYQEFMSRTEYNPFMHNAWTLMAKSQFYNGDFLQAASSFSYIARLFMSQPEIVTPAKIWQARSYSEMGWYYEAEDILSKIDVGHLSKSENDWFSTVYADYLIKQKQYKEAIPYMQTAIKVEKDGFQRARMKYLLGQMYSNLGQREMAYQTFGEVSSTSAPYILEFSAKIRQTEVYPGGDTTKVTKQLRKMAKSFKNKEYLDQVYYALGNVYMSIPDTAKAIASYELGVEKSTKKGLDKAFCQIKLGDIYFQQRKYVKAQPNYSEALGQLKKEDADYPRVAKRSEVLDELVVHFQAVELQDSLQRLARMSESERMAVVDKIIKDLIKKEEEEKKKKEREEFVAQQEEKRSEFQPMGTPAGVVNTAMPISDNNSFYFYNPQAVAIGKSNFQQKWGRRKLEDDWRRRNKTNPISDGGDTDITDNTQAIIPDSIALSGDSLNIASPDSVKTTSSDPKDPQFYLQQIPLTEEELEASNLIISDGLFNMGVIYKDKLEDAGLALETFNSLDTRFPDNENKMMAYYHTYLIYLRQGNKEMAELYKAKIRAEFPKSDFAKAMADPEYEYNLRMMDALQDSIYQQTYQSYIERNVTEVRKNYATVSKKYAQSNLMPKFMFLNALSYVQTNEADTFKVRLKELIEKYPTADVTVLAGEMMKGFQRGLILATSGDNMIARGSLFNIRFGAAPSDSLAADSVITFSQEKKTAHMLMLIYPQQTINENILLYTVASYNFGNFLVNDFDLQQTTVGDIGMLQIKGFNNYDEIIQYIQMINQPGGYAKNLEQAVLIVPISIDNYNILMKGKSLEEYMNFFEKHFGTENRSMIDRWKLKHSEELKTLSEEEQKIEDLQPEVEKEVKEELQKEQKTQPIIPVNLDKDTVNVLVPEMMKNDSIRSEKADSLATDTVRGVTSEEVVKKVDDVYNKANNTLEDANNAINEITSDPVRGIQNLFKKKKTTNSIDEYAKEQEKADKERQKQLKKEQAQKEKDDKALADQKEKEQKELLKNQEEQEKALLKEKKQREADLEKLKKAEEKQKLAEKERLKKEKEDARKKKQAAYEAEQKRKADDRKAKEKAYKEEQKIKEQKRKEAQKLKEEERKAKQKQREEEQKAKAKK